MVDEGGEEIHGRDVKGKETPGYVRTASDHDVEGSSVETEEDIATSEEIPSADEIIEMSEQRRRKLHPKENLPESDTTEEELEEFFAPHDRGEMEDIE